MKEGPYFEIAMDVRVQTSDLELFNALGTPEGLSQWWPQTVNSENQEAWEFTFGESTSWKLKPSQLLPHVTIRYDVLEASPDWEGTSLCFEIKPVDTFHILRLTHGGWKRDDHEFRRTTYCWALLLNQLKTGLETGQWKAFDARQVW